MAHYYLVGKSHAYAHKPSKGLMNLRLDRITDIHVAVIKKKRNGGKEFPEPIPFKYPTFNPQKYVEGVFGTFGGKQAPVEITLYFPAKVAKAVAEVDRHPSKRLAAAGPMAHCTIT